MKRIILISTALCISLVFIAACASRWEFKSLESLAPAEPAAPAETCSNCHKEAYDSWRQTLHSDPEAMSNVSAGGLKACGACHGNASAHAASGAPMTKPSSLAKSEQNALCGKCHFNIDLMGGGAIDPHGRHGVMMSVGLDEKWKRQLSCLDCHNGHSTRADMLRKMRAHVCFSCHKEAIVTMGIFQPFNYIGAGKVCLICHSAHGGSTGKQAARVIGGTAIVCSPCHI